MFAMLLAILYLCWGLFFGPRLASIDLPTLVPSSSIAYLHCADLHTHLKQLVESQVYQQFLTSPFFQHIQTTEGWHAFSSSFEAFWENLFLDPMRLFGTEFVLTLYETSPDDLAPQTLLVSRIDGVAKIAERLLYAFDRLPGHQVGITFVQQVEHVPVYRVKHDDMLLPLYYAVLDHIALVSTSLPLLRNTIRAGLVGEQNATKATRAKNPGEDHLPVETLAFLGSRLLTAYLEVSPLLQEFAVNPFWRSLQIVPPQIREPWTSFPPLSIFLDQEQELITLKTQVYAHLSGNNDGFQQSGQIDGTSLTGCKPGGNTEQLPVLAQIEKQAFTEFLQRGQELFFPQSTSLPKPSGDAQRAPLVGNRLECRLSQQLLGTLYAVPDIFCVTGPPNSASAEMAALHVWLTNLLNQTLSPVILTMLKHTLEASDKVTIGQVRLMLQPLLTYTAWPLEEQRSLAFAATNADTVHKHLAELATDSTVSPYLCEISDEPVPQGKRLAAQFFVQSVRFGEFLTALSATQTFRLLIPQKKYPIFYEKLPGFLLFLRSLPPLMIECGLQEQRLFAELQLGVQQ